MPHPDFTDFASSLRVPSRDNLRDHLIRPARARHTQTKLKRQDNTDLGDLLEMELDDVFLVPKTMLEEEDGLFAAEKNNKEEKVRRHGGGSSGGIRHQHRNLQEGGVSNSPSPSLASPTAAPTAIDRGISSSYFSYYDSPSAAPTTAPTMGEIAIDYPRYFDCVGGKRQGTGEWYTYQTLFIFFVAQELYDDSMIVFEPYMGFCAHFHALKVVSSASQLLVDFPCATYLHPFERSIVRISCRGATHCTKSTRTYSEVKHVQ